jgi:hypothetical protein
MRSLLLGIYLGGFVCTAAAVWILCRQQRRDMVTRIGLLVATLLWPLAVAAGLLLSTDPTGKDGSV